MESFASAVLALLLIAITSFDLRERRIPDVINAAVLATGLAVTSMLQLRQFWWALGAATAAYAAMWAFAAGYQQYRKRPGLGLGDVKLIAAATAWIGLEGLPSMLVLASASALLLVAARALGGAKITREHSLPFGPFLSIGIWLVWILGPISL